MAEILEAGYEELRKAIDPTETHNDFDTHQLLDDADNEILRATIADGTVEIVSGTAENPFTIQSTINGDDGRFDLPQTFAASRLFTEDVDGSEVTEIEQHTDVTLEQDEDQIVVEHDIEVPEI